MGFIQGTQIQNEIPNQNDKKRDIHSIPFLMDITKVGICTVNYKCSYTELLTVIKYL